MNRRIHTGTFDELIAYAIEEKRRNSKYNELKFNEKDMDRRQNPRYRPSVRMEDDKMEHDYPHTRDYWYTRRGNNPHLPSKPGPEVIPRRKRLKGA